MNEEETMPGWFYRIILIIGDIEGYLRNWKRWTSEELTHYAMIAYTENSSDTDLSGREEEDELWQQ